MGVVEGGEREQEFENAFEKILTGNFPNLFNEIVTQVQEVQSRKQDEPNEAQSNTHHN